MELKEYILKNECLEIHVCNLGGIIKNIFVRDCRWKLVDVVLGFDTLEQYIDPEYRKNYPYFGALIGRYGNRIKGGEITIDNTTYTLNKNEKGNTLHGGTPVSTNACGTWNNRTTNTSSCVTQARTGKTAFPARWTRRCTIPLKTTCSGWFTKPVAINRHT